jgi:mono/diheme cytochrome c family protein
MLNIKTQYLPTLGRTLRTAGLVLVLSATAGAAFAQRFSGFPDQGGEAIYKGICQGCHMPDGKGAVGAGAYPALAGNKRLGAKAYPALVILKGQKAMPGFAGSFDDTQIADVVNYIRGGFGNSFKGTITPAEVKALRATLPADH